MNDDASGVGELDILHMQRCVEGALGPMDDGELFVERRKDERLVLEDGRIKTATLGTSAGFGLRAVAGEQAALATSETLDAAALARAATVVDAVRSGARGRINLPPLSAARQLYGEADPVAAGPPKVRVGVLQAIEAYCRSREPAVASVTIALTAQHQEVDIVRADAPPERDVRPLVRLDVSVTLARDGRRDTASAGAGGRVGIDAVLDEAAWRKVADEALRQARIRLEAGPAPAGEMTVVLGPGWPGVLLHEAVGHGLEGDFNRKGTSAFAGLMGEMVAAPGVTIVDDGSIDDRRGSLSIDDEGTPGARTVLIENGRLVSFMQDRQNARLMNMPLTGNGRRQSYAHMPMPRMTNTFMLAGTTPADEIIASVERGLYARTFGGGQVDITSGRFVFQATEAYLIEAGKLTAPVKGAMLIGNGPEVLKRVAMVGDDLALDSGIGTCGKRGQGVPVGVGQPTLRIDGLTVGGTMRG